ncbi:MAG: hypothetical protein ACYC6B_04435 [Thermoleophilia bacterium]
MSYLTYLQGMARPLDFVRYIPAAASKSMPPKRMKRPWPGEPAKVPMVCCVPVALYSVGAPQGSR